VPLRADGSPLRAFRSPGSRIAAPAPPSRGLWPQWRLSDGSSPLTVARQLRFRTGFPWCPARNLSASGELPRCGRAAGNPLVV
jgi:hypothetical protein